MDESRDRINKAAGRCHEFAREILNLDWYDTESQARRVIEAMVEREKWQPMDTVPLDDTPVLVLLEELKGRRGSRIQHAQFSPKLAVIGNYFDFDMPKPIGWMHQPKAPDDNQAEDPNNE